MLEFFLLPLSRPCSIIVTLDPVDVVVIKLDIISSDWSQSSALPIMFENLESIPDFKNQIGAKNIPNI